MHWQRQVAIRRFSQDKQALGPDQEHTHTGQPEHTGEGARSPLCCRFTWGVWLVVVVGRQTRVWVATYVRVSTIVRYGLKYLSCLRQSSSQTHMCEILPNRYLLIKLQYLEYLSYINWVGYYGPFNWPFNGHFHMRPGTCSLRRDVQGICASGVYGIWYRWQLPRSDSDYGINVIDQSFVIV